MTNINTKAETDSPMIKANEMSSLLSSELFCT